VRKKLNAMPMEFADKVVMLVDGELNDLVGYRTLLLTNLDSIVRGTTSKEIIQMAKEVGAKKVIMASCAPPIRYVPLFISALESSLGS
jgi:amidophosphoribosyltransferase